MAWGGGILIYRFFEKPVLRDLKGISFRGAEGGDGQIDLASARRRGLNIF
jgi:hypothetical protein